MALFRAPKQRRIVSPSPDVVPSPPPIDTPAQAQSKLPLSEVKQKGGSHDDAPLSHGNTEEEMPLPPHDRSSQLQKTNKSIESKQNSSRSSGTWIEDSINLRGLEESLVWARGKLLQLRCHLLSPPLRGSLIRGSRRDALSPRGETRRWALQPRMMAWLSLLSNAVFYLGSGEAWSSPVKPRFTRASLFLYDEGQTRDAQDARAITPRLAPATARKGKSKKNRWHTGIFPGTGTRLMADRRGRRVDRERDR